MGEAEAAGEKVLGLPQGTLRSMGGRAKAALARLEAVGAPAGAAAAGAPARPAAAAAEEKKLGCVTCGRLSCDDGQKLRACNGCHKPGLRYCSKDW
jgi:hypothetical protein